MFNYKINIPKFDKTINDIPITKLPESDCSINESLNEIAIPIQLFVSAFSDFFKAISD